MKKRTLPKITLSTLRKVVVIAFIVILSFGSGYSVATRGLPKEVSQFSQVIISREVPVDKQTLNFSLFWRVWDVLHENYLEKDKLISSELVFGAIRGMVAAVGDPYTVFLPPDENKVIQEDLQGKFEGVGIQIGFKESRLAIIAPLPGTPAERAGLMAGDLIVGIKDEVKGLDIDTGGITLPEAVKAIRGPARSKVTLVIFRKGQDEAFDVEVTRARIDVPSIELKFVGDNEDIAHIKILRFVEETFDEWLKVVAEVESKGAKGIILDLRNNPGGFLQGAVDVGSEFVENGSVVVYEERSDGQRNEFTADRIGKFTNMPTVILVNTGSASASEILAGALKDIKSFTIVGESTFGKGTIQEPHQLEGGSALHITTARWLTPSGKWINEKGIDIDVEAKDDTETEGDEQLLKAIEVLSTNI